MSRIALVLGDQKYGRHAAALAFILTLSSYTLFRLFTYGLETGFYLIAVAGCFHVTLRIATTQQARHRDVILLGMAAGVAGAARIDFGLVFAGMLGIIVFYRWATATRALEAGAIALLIVTPWFWFVHRVSGSWLPTSGKAESTLIAWHTLPARAGSMGMAVAGEIMPWCYGVVSHATTWIALLSAAGIVFAFSQSVEQRRVLKQIALSRHGKLWLACFSALMVVYLCLFNARHFYYRYAAPLAVLVLPVCAVLLTRLAPVRRHMALVAASLWICFAAWAFGSLHTGRIGNSQTIAAGYIHEHFSHVRVGAFQSGVVGFFNPNVENLDGKLNLGALQAASAHSLPAFIDREHIDVLVDWPSILSANLPGPYLRKSWVPCPIPVPGNSETVCLQRRSSLLVE